MNKERAIYFAGLMEEYLNIPSCVCENIENELINGKYYKVINYVIERRKELENKANYKTYQELANIIIELQQENKKYKEVFEKALEYMKGFIFEPLLTNEDRKLIMYNDNLRNFEKILKEVE